MSALRRTVSQAPCPPTARGTVPRARACMSIEYAEATGYEALSPFSLVLDTVVTESDKITWPIWIDDPWCNRAG